MTNVIHNMKVDGQDGLMFYCPGCKMNHRVTVGEGKSPRWSWNNSLDKPTFSPSILVRTSRMTEKGRADHQAWIDAGYPERNGESFENEPLVCHSFVNDGKIQFLNDCTHELVGQTVDLPVWDDQEDEF